MSRTVFTVTCLGLLLLPGCGANPEPDRIRNVVSQVADAAQEEAMFNSIFVSGSAPANRDDYAPWSFYAQDPVSNQGSSATVKVTAEPARAGGAAGDDVQQKTAEGGHKTVEWKLEKVGEEWKIKSAPLP